jgi:hypothetical protein
LVFRASALELHLVVLAQQMGAALVALRRETTSIVLELLDLKESWTDGQGVAEFLEK